MLQRLCVRRCLEPRMVQHGTCCFSLGGIQHEHVGHAVLSQPGDGVPLLPREVVRALNDFLEQCFNIPETLLRRIALTLALAFRICDPGAFERMRTAEHLVQDNTARPNIHRGTIRPHNSHGHPTFVLHTALASKDDLRRHKRRTAKTFVLRILVLEEGTQTKVGNLDRVALLRGEQQVFRLDVSVHDARHVQLLNARHDLPHHSESLCFRKEAFLLYPLEDLATSDNLHY
mmetsp:Transcript_36251/g.96340  ORF Transcript_36251/g.96340 Transcript_36251/m.96340 type:complete len:231 (+) Transcript_36251:271-963(+)